MTGTRDKIILIAGLVTDRIGLSLLYIVFGPLVRELGLSENQFGWLMASANVAIGVASPYWGRKSQTLGRKPVLLIGLCGFAFGFLALGLSLQAGLQDWLSPGALFFVLLFVRLLYGLLAAGTQPAATAYIADTTDAANRGRGMALIGVAAGIGTVLGPAIGGLLSTIGAVLPLYVAAGLAAAAAMLTAAGLREPHRHVTTRPTGKLRFTDQRVLMYLVGWCVIVLVYTGVQTVTAFYLADNIVFTGREAVTRAISIAFLIMGIAMVITQGLVLQMFRISPKTLLSSGFLLFGIGLLVMMTADHLIGVYFAYALMGIAFSTINPGLNAGASLAVEAHEQGAVAGLLSAAPVVGMIIGPIAATAAYGIDPKLPMLLGALLTISAGGWFVVFRADARPGS
jgi:DHA1 family multidrug resistance protein-like MFS transporter